MTFHADSGQMEARPLRQARMLAATRFDRHFPSRPGDTSRANASRMAGRWKIQALLARPTRTPRTRSTRATARGPVHPGWNLARWRAGMRWTGRPPPHAKARAFPHSSAGSGDARLVRSGVGGRPVARSGRHWLAMVPPDRGEPAAGRQRFRRVASLLNRCPRCHALVLGKFRSHVTAKCRNRRNPNPISCPQHHAPNGAGEGG